MKDVSGNYCMLDTDFFAAMTAGTVRRAIECRGISCKVVNNILSLLKFC